MSKDEFIKKAVGVRWVNRGVDFDGMDCYGLFMLYYKIVLNVDIDSFNRYTSESNDESIEKGALDLVSGIWEEVERPKESDVFVCFRNGKPFHIGVIIDSQKAIHAYGGLDQDGSVQINSIRSIKLVFHDVKFYKLRSNKCQN